MPSFIDQMGREVILSASLRKIISVVPSQTELLFDLGLEKEIAGITKFCIHPAEKVKHTVKIGGTKKLNIELIRELNPDLIIGNKEENSREEIELLMKEFPVWMSDISSLQDALQMIKGIGRITGREQEAAVISSRISDGFADLEKEFEPAFKSRTAAYFIWRNPYMAAGQITFIDEMLQRMGLRNAFRDERYPVLTEEIIRQAKPDFIFLSSEPYPFGEKHIAEFQQLCPASKIILADGEAFSWYGSRLQFTPQYLRKLLSEMYG